jgi:hypothetical protein
MKKKLFDNLNNQFTIATHAFRISTYQRGAVLRHLGRRTEAL